MASGGSRFHDPQYKNWLKDTLALMYTKEGLEYFCNDQSNIFHKQLISGFGTASRSCTSCTNEDIKKDFRNKRWHMACTNCDAWLQTVISYHRNAPFPNLSPENTSPKQWLTVPWEIMKLYLPFGCEGQTSAKDADVQGILSLFKNCRHFSGSTHIGRSDLIDELLGIRNSLLHSGSFKVSDTDVQRHLQIMIDFLQGMKGLKSNQRDDIQESVRKIQELQSNVLDLSLNRELELRALLQGQNALFVTVGNLAYTLKDMKKEQETHAKKHDSLETEVQHQEQATTELKRARNRFDKFLLENDLTQDLARVSKQLRELSVNVDQKFDNQGHIIDYLEQRIDNQDQIIRIMEKDMPKSDVSIARCSRSKEDQHTDLQQHLLGIYENIGWENPVTFEEESNPHMYVKPAVKLSREKSKLGEMTIVKQPQSKPSKVSYRDVFYSATGLCKNIYITGDAGTGKTAFCNQLTLDWCTAVQNQQNGTASNDDLTVLSAFKFLFYVNLRNSEEQYHVEDMVTEHLLSDYSMSIKLSDLLKAENCLIVLDGLDEWTCPNGVKIRPGFNKHIPGRHTSKACTILTTTRNWKFNVIDLNTKDIDKHVELCGIDEGSSLELAETMLEYLERKCPKERHIAYFYTEVETKKLSSLLSVPVLLIHLITLWHFGKNFGNSQVQLFCNILDFLFERAAKNLFRKMSIISSKPDAKTRKLPDCFSTKEFCQKHVQLLYCLSKLAYESLFCKRKEDALVFKSSTLEIYDISESDINLCLQCGILSQNKHYSNYSGKYKTFSFLHKTVQEFLAAIYIGTFDPIENISFDLRQFFNSLDTVLEMAQVILFLAGINKNCTTEMLEHLTFLVATDKRVLSYRQTSDTVNDGLIKSIQNCVTDCIKEGCFNGITYDDIYLQDYVIDTRTICDVECLILWGDMSKVKSVFINTDDIDNNEQLLSIAGQLKQCKTLQGLTLINPETGILVSTVVDIMQNNCSSLISLTLIGECTGSDALVNSINRSISTGLGMLWIVRLTLTHNNIQQILHALSHSRTVHDLGLFIHCSDHDGQCRPVIDMNAISHLQIIKLVLVSLSVQNLPTVSQRMKCVSFVYVIMPMTSLLEFAFAISQTGQGIQVELKHITLTGRNSMVGSLEDFLRSCAGLVVSVCTYDNSDNTWCIEMKTTK